MLTEVAPVIDEHERERRFPIEIVRRIGELGWLGIPFPEDEGGAGLDTLAYAIAIEEIGRVWGSLGLIVAAHTSLGCGPLHLAGHARAAAALPRADGARRGHRRLRPDRARRRQRFGRDADDRAARGRPDGGTWVIDGGKRFITNAGQAGTYVVTARTGTRDDGNAEISAFIVPADTPGFASGGSRTSSGCMPRRPASSCSTAPASRPRTCSASEAAASRRSSRSSTAAGSRSGRWRSGSRRRALDASIPYAQTREQFGRPIGTFQGVAFMVADMATEIEAARGLVWRAAWLKDQGRDFGLAAAQAKLFASEVSSRVTNNAIQIHGGYGYVTEYPVERYLRDAKLTEIGEGTSQVQRLVIARRILGLRVV